MSKNAIFALLFSTIFCGTAQAEHYKIWFKAFIPSSGLDIVVPVPNSPGHFMIPGPHIAGYPFDPNCYNTNDRSFSSSVDAEAKITLIAEFDLLSPGVANFTKTVPDIGQTIQYDCNTGAVLQTGRASNSDVTIGTPSMNGSSISFDIDADAANPLINVPSTFVPSIKTHGTVTIDPTTRSIGFDGTIARFPSYEAYISTDGGTPKIVFQIAPDSAATAWSLVWNNHIKPTMPY